MQAADLIVILPEIVIVGLFAMVALLGAAYTGQDRLARLLTWVHGGCFWRSWSPSGSALTGGDAQWPSSGMFNDDGFARFAKVGDPAVGRGRAGHGAGLHAAPRYPALRIPGARSRWRSWA
jgi:hypothetical protein